MSDAEVSIPDAPHTASNRTDKKPRKPRAPKPVVEKRERRKPERVNTLLSRVKAMGPHHLDAYRVLRTDAMDDALRAEFSHCERLARASARVARAQTELDAADKAYNAVNDEKWGDRDACQTIEDLARKIAEAKGELPDDENDQFPDGPPDADPSDRRLDDVAAVKSSAIVSHDEPRNFPR